MSHNLLISTTNEMKPTSLRVKSNVSSAEFQLTLLTVNWFNIREIKLIKNQSDHLRFKKLDDGTGLIQLIDESENLIHKYTYKKLDEVINAFTLYRNNKQEFKDTFHLATKEEFEQLKAASEEKLRFEGSFNEQRILKEDVQRAAEKRISAGMVLSVIVVIFAVIRIIMRLSS